MADQGGNEGYFTYGMPPSQMMDFSRQTGPNNYSGQDVKPMLFPQYEGHANGTQNTAMMAHSGYQQNAQREGIVGQQDNSQREMMQHMLTSHQVHQQAQLAAIEPHRPSSSSAGAEGGAGMAATGGTDDSSENGAYTPKSHHIGGSQPFPLTTSMSSLSITPGSAAAPIGSFMHAQMTHAHHLSGAHTATGAPPSMLPASMPSLPSPMSSPDSQDSSVALTRAIALGSQTQRRPRSEKKPIPEELKDKKYRDRRDRNNAAAKKSRDERKKREDAIAIRASYLEKENATLRAMVETLREEATSLRTLVAAKHGHVPPQHQHMPPMSRHSHV